MIGASHIALAGALATCLAGIGGYAYGTRVGAAQEQSAQLRASTAAERERQRAQGQIDATAQAHQSAEYARAENVRTIYHESQTIVDRPVYRSDCIDADGVGLLDRAAATANGGSIAQPAGPSAETASGAAQ